MKCDKPKKSAEILNHINLTHHTKNYKKYIEPCINLGWLSMTIPDKPQSRSQKYITTEKGKLLLTILKYNSNKN